MYLVYSVLLTIGFLLMLPLFLLRREKYASGFSQRLGIYPQFINDGRPVIWLHCVSVGETNAARPLVEGFKGKCPGYRLIVSTTTRTGQELAQNLFKGIADAVFYFPFDWRFSVRRALKNYKPSIILLMETEIWPRIIREAKLLGIRTAIVNGRLSQRSADRYRKAGPFLKPVLRSLDLALMQGVEDANRLVSLGMDPSKVKVTGNIKFDLKLSDDDTEVKRLMGTRFGLLPSGPGDRRDRLLVVAASTHEPEERWVLEAFCSAAAGTDGEKPRLLIAPRHPERFDSVVRLVNDFRKEAACEWPQFTVARRSDEVSATDAYADVIILDSIGELRAVFPLADVVFVGGSIVPHGGQSTLEPAAAGKAMITGHYTRNFADITRVFLESKALIQLPEGTGEHIVDELFLAISGLLEDSEQRRTLGNNAAAVIKENRGAAEATVEAICRLLR